jgi:hypothetical protein
MSRLATVLLVAAAVPALADSGSQSLKVISEYSFPAPTAKCYFIRQANRQLKAPQDKPEFMPLTGLVQLPPVAPSANCMPDQHVIKAFTR